MTVATRDERYRVRLNVRRAAACAKGMRNPVAHHEEFLELIFALAGPGFQRAYDRFLDAPDGRRLLAERPDVTEVLTDTARMADCPVGTLGHAYVDFMTQNRLDASLYDDTHHDLPAIGARLGWDDDFAYVIHRGIALHDLLHVLGGYGPDVGGEFGVLAFTHGQVDGWVTGATRATLLALPLGVSRRDRLRFWREGVARGRAATVLFAAPYEELLDRPLAEVRAQLGIRPDHEAHPLGHIYSPYQFGRSEQRQMTHAYEPYRYTGDDSDAAVDGAQ